MAVRVLVGPQTCAPPSATHESSFFRIKASAVETWATGPGPSTSFTELLTVSNGTTFIGTTEFFCFNVAMTESM